MFFYPMILLIKTFDLIDWLIGNTCLCGSALAGTNNKQLVA